MTCPVRNGDLRDLASYSDHNTVRPNNAAFGACRDGACRGRVGPGAGGEDSEPRRCFRDGHPIRSTHPQKAVCASAATSEESGRQSVT